MRLLNVFFIALIPVLIIIFFVISLVWNYVQYKKIQPPDNQPIFPNNKELQYMNDKFNYWENIAICIGFIVVCLLAAILVAIYQIAFSIKVHN